MKRHSIRTVLAIVCIACAGVSAAESDTSAPDPDGRSLYMAFQCWQCHGYEGQGGAAPRVASKPYSYEAFSRFVRQPDLMPAYPPGILDDTDLRRIFDWVLSIPEPAPSTDIPALNIE